MPHDDPKPDPTSRGTRTSGAAFGRRPRLSGHIKAISDEGEPEGYVGSELRRAQVQQLVAESFTAELIHVLAGAVAVFLAWRSVSPPVLFAWSGSLLAIVVARGFIRRRFSNSGSPDEAILRVRIAVIASGLAWGSAALIMGPQLPFQDFMLLLVIFSGLVAGANITLVGDSVSFHGFAAAALGPLAVGIILNGQDRSHILALALLVMFAFTMAGLHRKSHAALLEVARTRAQLEMSERGAERGMAFLDGLLASAPNAIVWVDENVHVTGVNPSFERLFGFTPDEAIGKVLYDLIVREEDHDEARELVRRVRHGPVVAEGERYHKDGHPISVRISAAPATGEAEGSMLIVYDDITDVKLAEQAVRDAEKEYRALVESASDLVWRVDRKGTWTFLNAACKRIYGVDADVLLGRPYTEGVHPDHLDKDIAAFQKVLEGAELSDHDTVHIAAGTVQKHLSFSVRPLRNAAGEIVGAHGIARDVSERVAAMEALERAREEAEQATKAKSAFLANTSHEIRTPMNGVLGMIELLLETDLTPDQRRSAELVRDSAEALLAVLNDVLDFSKIEAGRPDFVHVPFDLHHVITTVSRVMGPRAYERQVNLTCEIDPDVPVMVGGDPGRLRQVFTNLVSNAVKFTEEGDVTTSVSLSDHADKLATLNFSVRDTGIGIPPDKLETIFTEFAQADSSITRQYGGTGLGLAISSRLVSLMGGELSVTSELGKGSEFTFSIQLSTDVDDAVPLAPADYAAIDEKRILIVDDNEANRRVVREGFETVGARVAEADTMRAALATLRDAVGQNAPYDLAVFDAYIHDSDGFELAGLIREDESLSQTRLMILTSVGRRGDGHRARELGIMAYLTKPITRTEMLDTTAAVLERSVSDRAGQVLITRHTIKEARDRLTILVAEDNLVNQQVVVAMLEKRGHRVEVVDNGRKAVDAVTDGQFDLVLMDIQMPELDGVAATQEIRAKGIDVPIVALTAHAMDSERKRCEEAGMNGFVTKPFKPKELFAAIVTGRSSGVAQTEERASPGPAAEKKKPAGRSVAVPPVNLETFRAEMREAGVEEAVDATVAIYKRDIPVQMDKLRKAVADRDAIEIESVAHAMKSASGSVRAEALAALLKQTEEAGRQGDLETVDRLMQQVDAEYEAVVSFLKGAGTT